MRIYLREHVTCFARDLRALLIRSSAHIDVKSSLIRFYSNQKLKKYNTVYDIIDKYFPVRYKTYELRKKYMIDSLEREVKLISNKAKFIQ